MWFDLQDVDADAGYGPEVLDAGWMPLPPPVSSPADCPGAGREESFGIAEFLLRFYANQGC